MKPVWKKYLSHSLCAALAVLLAVLKAGRIDGFELLIRELLLVFGFVAAVIDYREKRVPNQLVGAMLGAWILVIVPQLFLQTGIALFRLLSGAGGGFLGGLIFLIVYILSKKGLGGGDVKLMAVSGLYLGLDGVMPAMLYGSILAAAVGGGLILMKRLTAKDTIPLVPFLYVGMLLTIFAR